MLVWFLAAFVLGTDGSVAANEIVADVGNREELLPNGYRGLHSFSDEPISILSQQPLRYLMVAGDSTLLMQGRAIKGSSPVGVVLAPGSHKTFDDGYAGISAVYVSDKTIYGFYHAEEHFGEVHDPRKHACNPEVNYWSIGLAVSRDGGGSFVKKGQIITSRNPKGAHKRNVQGVGEVSVIPEPSGEYLYAYYADVASTDDPRGDGMCMARCPVGDVSDTTAWKKLLDGEFVQPGLGGTDSQILQKPFQFAGTVQPHVTFIKSMGRYFMLTLVVSPFEVERRDKAKDSGIYYCESVDGIRWSRPKQLLAYHAVPLEGREWACHPGLYLQKESPSKAEGWLIYAYTPSYGAGSGQKLHYLVRRRITLTRDAE